MDFHLPISTDVGLILSNEFFKDHTHFEMMVSPRFIKYIPFICVHLFTQKKLVLQRAGTPPRVFKMLSIFFTDEYLMKFNVSGVKGKKLAMKNTQAFRIMCGKFFFIITSVDRTKTFKLQRYTKIWKGVVSRSIRSTH
jgi:hypothetical protein